MAPTWARWARGPGLAQVVGAGVQLLDPGVALALLAGEEVRRPDPPPRRRGPLPGSTPSSGAGSTNHLWPSTTAWSSRSCQRSCAATWSASTSMSLSSQCSTSPSAARAPEWQAAARPQPCAVAHQPGALGADLGQRGERLGRVVGDDHLEQVGGVGLGGQAGEDEGQGALGPVGRDHHAHRAGRRPRAERRHRRATPSRCGGPGPGRSRRQLRGVVGEQLAGPEAAPLLDHRAPRSGSSRGRATRCGRPRPGAGRSRGPGCGAPDRPRAAPPPAAGRRRTGSRTGSRPARGGSRDPPASSRRPPPGPGRSTAARRRTVRSSCSR